ncbi:MAG TPA: hypothetical protein VMT85_06825 [Thermoanaerobaculia bacterium]|nr:hypothetical protein [Thermoanaerobaculia bacterium]
MSISLDAALAEEAREAAARAGNNLSGWLAEAARARLRGDALEDFLPDWESRHGALDPEEIERAERDLRRAHRATPPS